MVPSSPEPLAASCYSPMFKNSREIRENHKLAIIKLVLAWKTIAREQLLEGPMLPEGRWVLAVLRHSLASMLRPELGVLLKIECLFFMIVLTFFFLSNRKWIRVCQRLGVGEWNCLQWGWKEPFGVIESFQYLDCGGDNYVHLSKLIELCTGEFCSMKTIP